MLALITNVLLDCDNHEILLIKSLCKTMRQDKRDVYTQGAIITDKSI